MVSKRVLSIFLLLAIGGGSAHAATLDAVQALQRAIAVLTGDPYGADASAVARHIIGMEFLGAGAAGKCGKATSATWEFHVKVADGASGAPGGPDSPIDGYLAINAKGGEMTCASLPFLD